MNTKLHSLIVGLAIVVGVHSAVAQPALGIVATNNQFILFWPINVGGTNGVLQSAISLVSPNWLSATDAFPVNYGSQIAVSITNVPSARFFRLSLAPPTADGMAFIPGGSFTMGDTLDSEIDAIPTNVYVSGFYMDTNLMSYNQWKGFYYWAITNGYSFDDEGYVGSGNAVNHPVMVVEWLDCVKWSNARSKQSGLTPVYYSDTGMTQVYKNGEGTPYVNWSASGFRLPTEAEWEKAARGGLSGQRFPRGDTISESQANYYSFWYNGAPFYSYDVNSYAGLNTNFDTGGNADTSPVGYFAPNGYPFPP